MGSKWTILSTGLQARQQLPWVRRVGAAHHFALASQIVRFRDLLAVEMPIAHAPATSAAERLGEFATAERLLGGRSVVDRPALASDAVEDRCVYVAFGYLP